MSALLTKQMQPLLALLNQAQTERDNAQAACAAAQAAQRAATAQSDQLHGYRRDYEQRWGDQFRVQGAIELVHCYQGFTQRLTQAVDHQAQVARQAAERVAQAEAALRAAELRVASVQKLIERRLHEQRRAGDRRDQKQSDEFAARAAWNRQAAGASSSN